MTQASKSIEINVSPDDLYKVITDFRSYPEFVKDLKAIKVISEGENKWHVQFTLHIIKKIDYELKLWGEPGQYLKWELAKKGFMKVNNGGWKLEDLGGKTKATYSTEVDLGLLAPKSIVNMLVSTNFPAMLNAFKERAERLYG